MIKRVLCVIMCCVIIAALTLSLSAVDLPRNDLDGSVTLTSIRYRGYENEDDEDGFSGFFYPDSANTFEFGKLYNCLFSCFTGNPGNTNNHKYFSYFRFQLDWTITLNKSATIYIPYYLDNSSSIVENVSFGSLSQYRNSAKDFTVYAPFDFQYGYSARFVNTDDSYEIVPNYTETTAPLSRDITFYCFDNVPSGSYNLTLTTYDDLNSDTSHITFNFYMAPFITIPSIYDDFENGDITYDDAINDILDSIDDIIDDPTLSDTEKLVAIEVLKLDLIRIKQISDFKYNTVVSDFVDDSDSIIDDFVSGISNINDSIADLQMVYFNALSQAVTPEQGTYLNTAYQVQVSKLHLLWQIDFYDNLEQIVTDEKLEENSEKLSHLDELHAQEKEVLSNFELAEFESQLEFSLWTDALPYDYSNYRTIFEYLLEDNKAFQISQFLIVPFSLVLVSVLLATTNVVIGGFSRYHDSYGTKPFSFRRGGKK